MDGGNKFLGNHVAYFGVVAAYHVRVPGVLLYHHKILVWD